MSAPVMPNEITTLERKSLFAGLQQEGPTISLFASSGSTATPRASDQASFLNLHTGLSEEISGPQEAFRLISDRLRVTLLLQSEIDRALKHGPAISKQSHVFIGIADLVSSNVATPSYLTQPAYEPPVSPLAEYFLQASGASQNMIVTILDNSTGSLTAYPVSHATSGLSRLSRWKGRPVGPIQYFTKLLHAWDLTDTEGAKLLGIETTDQFRDLLRGVTSLRGRDLKDRLHYLIGIDLALDALFRSDARVKDWLRTPLGRLHDDSPLDHLLEGSMEHLLRVKELVEFLSGR